MNEYFKRDYLHLQVRINEVDSIINRYKEDGYKLLSTFQSEPGSLHLYFEKYVVIDELNEQSTQDKIIRATRKSNVTKQTLSDTFTEKGLVGVYNLGLKNMLDYLNGNWIEIQSEKWGNKMETNVRDIILKALENEWYLCELTKEGIIFVDDEDTNTGVAIHIQTMT